MLVKYYTGSNITYTSRKRYKNINSNFNLIGSEEQRSVKLGDGAQTTVKTSVDNICDYVIIGDTRWFVHHYVYLNGGQIMLYLQRDVIGEKGLANNNLYGKIERGYTDSVLKYRKELDLNQILTNRIPLISSGGLSSTNNPYYNYYTSTHNKEKWGILYFLKNSEGKINLSVNVPGLSISYADYPFINNNTIYAGTISQNFYVRYRMCLVTDITLGTNNMYKVSYTNYQIYTSFTYSNNAWTSSELLSTIASSYYSTVAESNSEAYENFVNHSPNTTFIVVSNSYSASTLAKRIASYIINYYNDNEITVPESDTYPSYDYNNTTIRQVDSEGNVTYYQYTVSDYTGYVYKTNYKFATIVTNALYGYAESFTTPITSYFTSSNNYYVTGKQYTYTEISALDAGDFTITYAEQLVDEPYVICCIPLYTCTITKTDGTETYNIEQDNAQQVFNSLIEALSGDNAYIADAQIIPYAPNLRDLAGQYLGIPLFGIPSSFFEVPCSVQLQPYQDIKKEYIKRQYSIVAPDKSDKFSFNFYDYVNKISDIDGDTDHTYNGETLDIKLKFALKPYAVITSAVIQTKYDGTKPSIDQFVLQGIPYNSDLRGCQPDSAGFEKSISTNQYEEYARSNSNYQQIFNKNQEYLALQNETELINESTSAIVNTVSSATMGAIAGASMVQGTGGALANAVSGGAVSTAAQAAAGAYGALAAGGITAAASAYQIYANTELRSYEYNMQQTLFNLQIGTIKNLPNSLSRISSFNEIIMQEFYYTLEVYECTQYESNLVDNYIDKYGYGIGAYGNVTDFYKEGWFLRSTLITSSLPIQLHEIADNELKAGIYYYEEEEEI